MTKCRTCGAPILWAKTVNGRNMPLDAEPVDNGNLFIDQGVAVYVHYTAGPPPGATLYKSHFATCPDRDEHRRASHDT